MSNVPPEYVAIEPPDALQGIVYQAVYTRRGTKGYFRFPFAANVRTLEEGDAYLAQRFGVRTPDRNERDAAWCGSQFGWNGRTADPLHWAQIRDIEKQRARGEIPLYDPRAYEASVRR